MVDVPFSTVMLEKVLKIVVRLVVRWYLYFVLQGFSIFWFLWGGYKWVSKMFDHVFMGISWDNH